MNQCVGEIEAEPDGDDRSDDWLSHDAWLLKLPESNRVQRQKHDTERNKRDIEHDRLPFWRALTAEPRKFSIPNRPGRNKDFVMTRLGGT